jgi:hypothetical protein
VSKLAIHFRFLLVANKVCFLLWGYFHTQQRATENASEWKCVRVNSIRVEMNNSRIYFLQNTVKHLCFSTQQTTFYIPTIICLYRSWTVKSLTRKKRNKFAFKTFHILHIPKKIFLSIHMKYDAICIPNFKVECVFHTRISILKKKVLL